MGGINVTYIIVIETAHILGNHICSVMVSMMVSSAVDYGFGQIKEYKIGIC
jgi:hypothetical protein